LIDIYGFSAWSSERESAKVFTLQVFTLLQTVFFHFEKIARHRKVFKVETIGHNYVACCGIPEVQVDHPIRMAKFAQECIFKFKGLTKALEKTLGPETGDLEMRFCLASGPATAGILAGAKSKFHLPGDTAEAASSMQTTSEPGRIQISSKTKDLLIEAGKKEWIQRRKELTIIKGQEGIQSYFLTTRRHRTKSEKNSETDDNDTLSVCSDLSVGSSKFGNEDSSRLPIKVPLIGLASSSHGGDKNERLVEWQVESMLILLKQIVAYRQEGGKKENSISEFSTDLEQGETLLAEVKEVVKLPDFHPVKAKKAKHLDSVKISPVVVLQLRDFVGQVADLYHDNPFHNFEHASDVVMSVHKLLNRIVSPEDVDYRMKNSKRLAADLHDYSKGRFSEV
jgi:class 3 adenylate cyclase